MLDANTKDAHLERIRRDGYSIVENAIEPDLVAGFSPSGNLTSFEALSDKRA